MLIMSSFVHLHTHSHYSLLNALPKIDDLIDAAKEEGMEALALTDNGNLYGVIEFYKSCKKANIKPILGIDAYVAGRTRADKQAGVDNRRTRLVLLAKNNAGYQNLIKLVTDSHLEGFYYKPRLDKELIEKYSAGLLCIAPSFSGAVSAALKMKDYEKAKELVAWYKKVYGDDSVYLEITHHPDIEGHESLVQEIIELGKTTNTPLVAAHDVYYLKPEDKKARDTLMLVQSGGDLSERAESAGDFSFIGNKEAGKLFKNTPEALENTLKIASLCNINLELGKWVFPDYKVGSGLSYDDELRRLVYEGLGKRNEEKQPEVEKRIEYELKVIKDKG